MEIREVKFKFKFTEDQFNEYLSIDKCNECDREYFWMCVEEELNVMLDSYEKILDMQKDSS